MRWMILLVALTLSACFSGSGKRGGETLPAVYDFGPPVAALSGAPRKAAWGLEVKVPQWMDTQGIDYRLAYVDSARIREYALARWAGPPSQLIQQRLAQRLQLTAPGQGRVDCLLRIEVNEFSQLFRTPGQSVGVLVGKAVLLDRSRRPLGELVLNFEQSAPTLDASGGVAALTFTVDALGEAILAWEQRLQSAGQTATCAAAG